MILLFLVSFVIVTITLGFSHMGWTFLVIGLRTILLACLFIVITISSSVCLFVGLFSLRIPFQSSQYFFSLFSFNLLCCCICEFVLGKVSFFLSFLWIYVQQLFFPLVRTL